MIYPRQVHAVCEYKGHLIASGGEYATGIDSVEEYSPQDDRWT